MFYRIGRLYDLFTRDSAVDVKHERMFVPEIRGIGPVRCIG